MLVTKQAPDFTATAVMPDNSFKDITLSDFRGKKVVLFFYPLDFTYVWPTELIAFDHRLGEFEKRNVQVLGCSVDSQFSHLRWKEMEINNGGIGKVNYPLISDLDKSVARAYDVLLGAEPATVMTHDDEVETSIGGGVTMRGSFLIDEDGTVRHAVLNDLLKSHETNFKGVGQPLRIALTGSKFGPGIYDIIISLGKEEVQKRLRNKILS